jgi:two-component system sensor histidine kinase KdpD
MPPDLPLVSADALLVEQALGNVIGNAVEHTPSDTLIAVSATVSPSSVSIAIQDNGPGISPEILPRAFEKFVSVKRSSEESSNRGEGTGLGLAIAKGIMKAHGGDVMAKSPTSSGLGTRIELAFPREKAAP